MNSIESELLLEQKLLQAWPLAKWQGMTIVVACSGGADSTALLRALHRIASGKVTIKVAHFNHQLRGADSDADEAFVRDLCLLLQLDLEVRRTEDVLANSNYASTQDRPLTSEDDLRQVRYAFFESYANRVGARYVAMAHTADDQVETVLHRWCRGSGFGGLSGIPMFRNLGQEAVVARPLLNVWRGEVIDYLNAVEQSYRTDCSNLETTYTRNRIRNLIVPLLESQVHPNAKENILAASTMIGEVNDWLVEQAVQFIQAHVTHDAAWFQIDLDALRQQRPLLAREIMRQAWILMQWPQRDLTRNHWQRLVDDLCSGQCRLASTDLPGLIRLSVEGRFARLTKVQVDANRNLRVGQS